MTPLAMSSLRLRVLVEQNAELALELARHGYVLETGTIAPEGEAREVMNNEHVWKAYLGIWQKFLTFTFSLRSSATFCVNISLIQDSS